MAKFQISRRAQYNSVQLDRVKEYSGSLVTMIDGEVVADAETDKELIASLDVSACKAFYLVSDQNVTFETNDGGTPADTIALLAGVPYVWATDDYNSFLLGTDITSVFITNGSGQSATIHMWALVDPTP